jgi:hypothetical protein
LKPTIVSFLLILSQALSDFFLKFLRLEADSELWVDSIVGDGRPKKSGFKEILYKNDDLQRKRARAKF